ncbi:hypothetical protein [Allorhodopirellula solitaria]|nr:hypothetical protein [Allorhodopirellula solitaria]
MQQAVGAYLDSETLIENDQIIHDRVLAVSDGFVKEYDVTDGPNQRPDGLYEVAIKADVQRGKVQERLEAIRVIESTVAGKDAAAEVFTKIANAEQGQELLEKHLDGLLEKLLVARLVGEDGKPSEQVRPIVEIQEDHRIKCTWNIEVYFDMKAFYEQVVPQLDKVFRAVSEGQPGSCVFMGRQLPVKMPTGYPVLRLAKILGSIPNSEIKVSGKPLPILLSVGRDKFGTNERFRVYLLSSLFYKNVLQDIRKCILTTELHLYVLDEDDRIVRQDLLPLNEESTARYSNYAPQRFYPEFLLRFGGSRYEDEGMILAPRFVSSSNGTSGRAGVYTDTLLIPYSFMIEQSDLESISSVRFRFAQ